MVGAAERLLLYQRNSRSSEECLQSALDAVWNEKTVAKASEKLIEVLMQLAAEQTLEISILERIVMSWLNRFDDSKNPALELEAEKFTYLGAKTGLGYNIAFLVHQKVLYSHHVTLIALKLQTLYYIQT